ncbi:MAG: TonB-dependent receptor [Lysobacteraceae bacterium]
MSYRSPSLFALVCAAAWSLAVAADPPRQPEIVVSATRTEATLDSVLASVEVIDRAAIEASDGDVLTLLRSRAGVDIVRGGGLGQQTSLFLRGGNSSHVLVLIDGVRVASANTGGHVWEHLPLAQIERIEIVRGPRAALFGSDAIGGVIQIFTRRPVAVEALVGLASHDTWRVEAGAGRAGAHGEFGVRAAMVDSVGFSAQNAAGFSYDPDDDGYRQRSLNLSAGLDGERLRLDGQWLYARSEVEFDQGESRTDASSARLALSGGQRSPWSLALGHHREDLDTPVFFSRYETRRWQLEAQRVQPLGGRGEWLHGASLVHDEGVNLDTFAGSAQYAQSRRQRAVFVDWRDGHGALDWQLGARHDDFDSFGGRTSLQAALGWRLGAQARLRLNAGEGFRAPTLNELYSPGFGGLFAGNADLDPERARNLEAGFDWQGAGVELSLAAYRNRVRDLIDFSGGECFQAINIARADLRGIELQTGIDIDDWRLSANLGWQRARDADSGLALLRRAARKATLGIERDWRAARLGLELHGVSARADSTGELPGYALLGAWLNQPLSRRLTLQLRLDNILDRDYVLIPGYNTPGATASVQLRWMAD